MVHSVEFKMYIASLKCSSRPSSSRNVHGNEEEWDPMGPHGIPMRMGIRLAMVWERNGNGNEVHEWELRRGSGKDTA